MELFNNEKIAELVFELKSMVQSDADELASEIEVEIIGDFSPYNDGDEMIDGHIDLLSRAEEMVSRYNS